MVDITWWNTLPKKLQNYLFASVSLWKKSNILLTPEFIKRNERDNYHCKSPQEIYEAFYMCDLVVDIYPNFFDDLNKLSYLSLENTRLGDYTEIGKLVNLEGINFTDFKRGKSVDFLVTLTNIKRLELPNLELKNLNFVEKIASLEYLDIEYNKKITNIIALSNLENLKELNLGSLKKLEDLSPISNLKNLESLIISSTNVSDITLLENLENLKILSCINVDIPNIDVVSKFTKLEELYISSNLITDFSPLENLISLKKLILTSTNFKDISKLKNLKNLEYINLNYTKNLENLEVLGSFTQLKSIDMYGIVMSDISFEWLSSLKELTEFNIMIPKHLKKDDVRKQLNEIFGSQKVEIKLHSW